LACIILASCLSKAGRAQDARLQLSRAGERVDRLKKNSSELRVLAVATANIELLEAEGAAAGNSARLVPALSQAQSKLTGWRERFSGACELEVRAQVAVLEAEFARLSNG
jgi:hypothetical protein